MKLTSVFLASQHMFLVHDKANMKLPSVFLASQHMFLTCDRV